MFMKPFKIKSNYQLKGTERKKLCEQILSAYPNISDEDIQLLLPKKESISIMKVVLHNGHTGMIYCAAKIPKFFHLNLDSDILSPTIYTLWHHPQLLKTFTIHTPVVSKLMAGADLMLPGLVLKEPVNLYSFGKLPKGTLVSINTEENKAPVAVGLTALSSEDMYLAAGHGRCVKILHVIGDMLCQIDSKSPMRPNLGPPNIDDFANSSQNVQLNVMQSYVDQTLSTELENQLDLAENSNDSKDETASKEHVEETENVETEDLQDSVAITAESEVLDPVQEMDRLLEYCFLKACKMIKSNELPMLSSYFFKNHLLAACPPGKNVDVKKSRYKKLSVFLENMKAKGVINTSILKGVETLLSIKSSHPLLKELVITEEAPVTAEPTVSNSAVVSECYKVTADVLPVLSKFGYEKGDVMKRMDIRKCFTEYVKSEDLQDGKTLKLNPQLAGIMRTKVHQETVTMEDGINKFIGRMTRMYEISVAGNTLLHTGKLEPIDMRVTVRANGKKVTLVNNLETFGINLREFSKECQSIGASATIIDDPGKKTPSVLVQGNQILYVYKLLTEKYQIKRNYIRGLEFAPKKKK